MTSAFKLCPDCKTSLPAADAACRNKFHGKRPRMDISMYNKSKRYDKLAAVFMENELKQYSISQLVALTNLQSLDIQRLTTEMYRKVLIRKSWSNQRGHRTRVFQLRTAT